MKKHKILLAVISALMATGMIFAAACGGGYSETQNNDKLALLDLVVDFGAAKAVIIWVKNSIPRCFFVRPN